MTTQPEQILENNLVEQLTGLRYDFVHIHNEDGILTNLKSQLESFNNTTFSVEFGGNVADVLSVDGALGFAAGLPKITDVKGYGSVGLSLGASAGASGDLALGLNASSPEDSGGPFISFILEGDFNIGGGIVVSFNLPDLSFGGFTIPVSAGEEVNLSVGGGYTFIFN